MFLTNEKRCAKIKKFRAEFFGAMKQEQKTGKIRCVPCKLNNVNMNKHLGQFLIKVVLKSNKNV